MSEKKEPAKELTALSLNEQGLVVAKNNQELLRYCGAMIASEMVPKQFNTPQKLLGALMFVRTLKLPDTFIRFVAMVHGTPSLFGDGPLALAERTGELELFNEHWFDEKFDTITFENKNLNAEVYGGVCFIKRKGREKQSFSYTLSDANQAGLYPSKNDSMPWAKHTRIMLRYKARSLALKSQFADALGGTSIAEYDHDELPQMKDVTPTKSNVADDFNKLFEEGDANDNESQLGPSEERETTEANGMVTQ